ncbi:dihydropyrimidinase [Halodurantibacterium flavum]|uniref:Dihydropyrimidinase n=1 Tax=Halodurantibacterium flavum TaxID=1382802 RepID=A0ABW4S1L0_9RHOB
MSTVIKGGTIVAADRSYAADILIEGDTIAAIGPGLSGDRVIDAEGAYVLPGGIDPHTHLEMPFMGTTTAETWESGTFAAVSGGTTMVVDFVIPGPDGMLPALDLWAERAARQASCDYGFHMSVTGWSEQIFGDMEQVVARGVNSFKHFMAYKGALMVNDDEMFASFTRCAQLGALPLVHAENGDLVAALQQKYLTDGVTGPEGHSYSRPPAVEGEATNRAIMIADAAGVPVYIVHTSSEEAHEAIRRARQVGQRVYGEPLIQHLLLDDSVYASPDWDFAAQRVMSPPFRDKRHQESLWAGLVAGSLQVVATDHCAFTLAQKQLGRGDFTRIPNGTGGLEDRMSLLWHNGVGTGRITMNEFVAVTSTNIAQILNIYPRKGAILPGSDADLVVWDPKASKTITAAGQKSVIDYNVFEGHKVTGLPRYTLSRGAVVWDAGRGSSPQPGRGQHVARPAFPAVSRAYATWKELVAPRPVNRAQEHMPIGV